MRDSATFSLLTAYISRFFSPPVSLNPHHLTNSAPASPRRRWTALPAGPSGRDQTPDEIFAALDKFDRNYKALQATKRKQLN